MMNKFEPIFVLFLNCTIIIMSELDTEYIFKEIDYD